MLAMLVMQFPSVMSQLQVQGGSFLQGAGDQEQGDYEQENYCLLQGKTEKLLQVYLELKE